MVRSRSRQFESQHRILDGSYSHLFAVKFSICLLNRPEINEEEAVDGPFFKFDCKVDDLRAASEFVWAFHIVVPGSNPKHTIYSFTIYSHLPWYWEKDENKQKKRLGKQVDDLEMVAIPPWFRLRLPSCSPGFKSQAHHLRLFLIALLKF